MLKKLTEILDAVHLLLSKTTIKQGDHPGNGPMILAQWAFCIIVLYILYRILAIISG